MLRVADTHDVEIIARIQVASWRAAYADLLPRALLDALDEAERARAWREYLRHAERMVLLAVAGERVLGFSALMPSRDPDAPPGTAEIVALYVDPPWFRRGVGTELTAPATAGRSRCSTRSPREREAWRSARFCLVAET